MASGLQVWDAAGTLILDTNTIVLKEFTLTNVLVNGTGGDISLTNIPPSSTVLVQANSNTIPTNVVVSVISNNTIRYSTEYYGDGTTYADVRGLIL